MKQIVIEIPEYKDYKSARAAIDFILGEADKIEAEACEIADRFGVEFYTSDYGSGRTYYPKGSTQSDADWNGWDVDDEGKLTEGVWQSSSDQC